MRKIINYDEICTKISLNSCSIVGHPKSGKASLLNYITKSFNHISRLNKINIIYRNSSLDLVKYSFVTCFSSLQTTLGQISVLQISQICLFVISIDFNDYIHHILETLMCIECCKIYFCLICITHTEIYDKSFVDKNINKLKKIINLTCKYKFLIINPIHGYNMNQFNNIINYYSKQYWIDSPLIINNKPYFTIIRSYDLTSKNKSLNEIYGGIVGGYTKNGFLSKLTNIYIKPGMISNDNKKTFPIKCNINNIKSGKSSVNYSLPKSIFGLELSIDPYFTSDNKLRGQILGPINNLPPVYINLAFKFNGLKKIFLNSTNQKEVIMKPLAINEDIILCINSIFINGSVYKIANNTSYFIKLHTPQALDLSNNAVVFRKINRTWIVSGFAKSIIGEFLEENFEKNINISSNDSILITFSKKNNLIIKKQNIFFIKKNLDPLVINSKFINNKIYLSYDFKHELIFPQYSKFKLKNNQIEEALKKNNILYTKKDYVELNLTHDEYINNYYQNIKDVFKCKKCNSYTFMFYKNSINIQICSNCGDYLILS